MADESAEWRVAGLRQIDRIVLALNDFFGRSKRSEKVPVFISGCDRGISRAVSLSAIRLTSDLTELSVSGMLVISTRVVPSRGTFRSAFAHDSAKNFPGLIVDNTHLTAEIGALLFERLRAIERESAVVESDWGYLESRSDIARCARQLFRKTGKSQDGIISRLLNRPLSRGLSRLLVHLPLSPNQWTIWFMSLPVVGACFVIRGDYFGFALGAVLFQLHSALDGCDGEVARIKYQESAAGKKLDAVCDRLSTLLFAISLGFGLARQQAGTNGGAWLYVLEGISAALLIGVTETWLTHKEIGDEVASKNDRYSSYVTEHRQSFNEGDQLKLWMIRNSGMLSFGEAITRFFGELTKRDVFNFVFMILALCGRPQWVLHILAFCACAIVIFAVKEIFKPIANANSAA